MIFRSHEEEVQFLHSRLETVQADNRWLSAALNGLLWESASLSIIEVNERRYLFLRSNHRIGKWKVSQWNPGTSCYTSLTEDHLNAAIDESMLQDDSDYTPTMSRDSLP